MFFLNSAWFFRIRHVESSRSQPVDLRSRLPPEARLAIEHDELPVLAGEDLEGRHEGAAEGVEVLPRHAGPVRASRSERGLKIG